MGLRELYGGQQRRRTLAVVLASGVGGSLTGVLVVGGFAGASAPPYVSPVRTAPLDRAHVHPKSPTPAAVVSRLIGTPSHSPSPSETPSPTRTPATPSPTSTPAPTSTTTPSPSPTATSPTPTGSSAPPSPGDPGTNCTNGGCAA